ncbi:MAG: UTP--glucose-1-phosphate uridylyltransferase [Pirellulales bacterium]|jgi:UTP--glucose-1-phosphate uridylyltransferase|nr:UTP--glucose-1-phosphate uridylyltransferase [Pirellulales bacterium]
MKIKRAVITAASRDDRHLPLQQLVDRDRQPKAALAIIVEEAVAAGAHEVAVVIRPGDEAAFREAAGPAASRLELIPQPTPAGYGDALCQARAFVGEEPFLHFVGDHLYVSDAEKVSDGEAATCSKQLVAVAEAEECCVSAVQATREHMLPYFGAVGGQLVPGRRGLYTIEKVLEKPTPTLAEQELTVPGLRAGHHLCFFGMHVLTPAIFELLHACGEHGQRQLSPALAALASRERFLALELSGRRYNLGLTYGLLTAQLALGLAGPDRSEILAQLVELLAKQPAGE